MANNSNLDGYFLHFCSQSGQMFRLLYDTGERSETISRRKRRQMLKPDFMDISNADRRIRGGMLPARSSAIPRSLNQASGGFCGFLCGGRQVNDAGLREEMREGAKGGNFLLGLDREPLSDPANPFFFFFSKIIKSCGCQPSCCNVWRVCTKVKGSHYYFQRCGGQCCRNKRCVIALS